MKNEKKLTAVLGASTNPTRYAYMAADRLHQHGHPIKLLSIKKGELFGEPFQNLRNKPDIEGVDTVTLYIGSDNLDEWQDYILSLNPKRIIFNPGTENEALASAAQAKGIETIEACTLVMLGTGQF
ncbi:CoA-binding protein [Reichenbachiella agarivorans]|uniref:CoA-binding protein n=1 Tax=Reichenbachiella agarivorans TaxID=2979464 RepID=A0ABY6CQA5_9BACT|nr:CoA-binding protein [Reichenbachiella agarivorans]UXP32703.1 CoA-binding protein [Reichenbachiella agarivorans]